MTNKSSWKDLPGLLRDLLLKFKADPDNPSLPDAVDASIDAYIEEILTTADGDADNAAVALAAFSKAINRVLRGRGGQAKPSARPPDLTPAGEILPAIIKPTTRAEDKFLTACAEIRLAPDAVERAYLARELVQCTLPHSNPGDVPLWTRSNGDLTLVVARTGFDQKTLKPVGYPYGSIPRLLLFWINTEAVRTGKRRLDLGDTFSDFIRELGLDSRGGGPRSDYRRVREQMMRLFSSAITFQQTGEEPGGNEVNRWLDMRVTVSGELWWSPKHPDQVNLWGSWLELGEKFFRTITTAPVPTDLRHLRALKQSPLALDLYVWATHKAYTAATKNKSQFVPWIALSRQFGADYKQTRDFKQKAVGALKKIQEVYSGLKLEDAPGGIVVLATSRPAVASGKLLDKSFPR